MNQAQEESKNTEKKPNIPFWRVVLSVIQASFGVQSSQNRERDFTSSSVWPFITAALFFTLVFILTLVLVVKLVLAE